MQPFNRFSMNTSLDRSQILNYTTDFHFFPYEVAVLLTCKHFKSAFLKSPSIYVFIYHRYIKGLSVTSLKRICYLPSAQIIKYVVEFVIQEIGGAEGHRWRCRRLFYVVPLKTQNMCCRMNHCMSHAFLTQVMCFAGLYQRVTKLPQKLPHEQLGISLVSSEIQKLYRMMPITQDVKHQ